MPIISQRLYNEVMMADNFTCVYCGIRTPNITIDHFVPRSQNGPDVLPNLVAACAPCNGRKGDRSAHEMGMIPRFGRFQHMELDQPNVRLRKEARRVRVPSARTNPSITQLKLPREERAGQIRQLASELKEDGTYLYSANTILKMTGGTAADVKEQIRAIRAPKPAPDLPTHAIKRPTGGWAN